jgi:AcrR family transcriptional regulator
MTIELSPREKRQQRTHQAILDAARQILKDNGIEGLSIRAIADRIDYSPAALYEYFGSKEEIIQALCRQGNRRLKAYMEQVDTSLPFQEYLLNLGLTYIEFAVQNPDFFLLMFTTMPASAPSLAALEQKFDTGMMSEDSSFVILVDAIRRGVAEDILHPRPGFGVFEMAFAAWSTVHGIAMLRVTHLRNFEVDFNRVSQQTLLALGKGLALL